MNIHISACQLFDDFISSNCNEKKKKKLEKVLMRSKLEIEALFPGGNINQSVIIISLIL